MHRTDDLYEILQVHYLAEPEVIQAAYRSLARKYHPDVNHSPEAEEIMKRLTLAHEVLSDPVKRAAYDSQRASNQRNSQEGNARDTRERRARREQAERERQDRERRERAEEDAREGIDGNRAAREQADRERAQREHREWREGVARVVDDEIGLAAVLASTIIIILIVLAGVGPAFRVALFFAGLFLAAHGRWPFVAGVAVMLVSFFRW